MRIALPWLSRDFDGSGEQRLDFFRGSWYDKNEKGWGDVWEAQTFFNSAGPGGGRYPAFGCGLSLPAPDGNSLSRLWDDTGLPERFASGFRRRFSDASPLAAAGSALSFYCVSARPNFSQSKMGKPFLGPSFSAGAGGIPGADAALFSSYAAHGLQSPFPSGLAQPFFLRT